MEKGSLLGLLSLFVISLFMPNRAEATAVPFEGSELKNYVTTSELVGNESITPSVALSMNTDDYCYPTGTITRSDRYINSIAVVNGDEEFLVSGINKSAGRGVYQNLSADNVATVTAGSTVQVNVDWTGAWMHGFVYVDYNQDGQFSYDLNNGVPAEGSELVSFTYYDGKNSKGESTSQEGKLANVPSFELPRNLAPGYYRIRVKIDWDYVDPCGRDSGMDNSNAANGGDIIDFTLNVVEAEPLPDFFTVTLPSTVANGTLAVTYTDAEGALQTLTNGANTVPTNSVLTITATPADGYQLAQLTVNGVNFTSGSTCVVDEEINVYVFFTEIGGLFSGNPFETMIRLGRMTAKSPIYQMPTSGTVSGGYITAATTSGDAVSYPLGYVKSSAPGTYFTIVSKETSLLSAGATFELNATLSANVGTVTVYTDWNRDGVFEPVADAAQVSGKNFTQAIAIPEDAQLGKNRIRVRLESSTPTNADAAITGRVYDFIFYVTEASTGERTDCFISVTSSNNELGSAMIETAAKPNGRYDIGTQVTVKAVINTEVDGVEFKGWQKNGETVSEDLIYTFTVETNLSLVALFEAPEPVLATPKVSTAENPVWYQIMNAHTDANRCERYLAYDTNLDDTYTKELRAEKPASTTDKFLWRLEDAGNDQVYLVNKSNNLQVYSNGTASNTTYLSAATEGSKFAVVPSGHENGSFSIKYEGDDAKMLNAQDGSWGIVLYNAGVGTGSGWYFYEVETTGIEGTESAAPKANLCNGHLTVTGLSGRNTLRTVSLSGQMLGTYVATDTVFEGNLKYAERFIILVIESEEGEQTILKLVDSRI